MGKRKNLTQKGNTKKFKAGGFVDPNTSGIYATCNRGKEQQCRKELMNLFAEKAEEYFDLSKAEPEDEELSIEDQIKREVEGMKNPLGKELLKPIELDCECLVFIKTRKPIEPDVLVQRLCEESLTLRVKTTRYTQRLSPVSFSVTPTLEELRKLSAKVMAPHFHTEGQKPLKFAIQITKRNFNALERDVMIKTIAECVGKEHGHKVDLKEYDKLIMVECYKSNIGMSVVNRYLELEKFNLQQIFEKHTFDEEKEKEKKEEGKEKEKEEGKEKEKEEIKEKEN